MFIPHWKYFGSSPEYIPLGDGLGFIKVCDILSHITDQLWSWDKVPKGPVLCLIMRFAVSEFQSKVSFDAGVQYTFGGLPRASYQANGWGKW